MSPFKALGSRLLPALGLLFLALLELKFLPHVVSSLLPTNSSKPFLCFATDLSLSLQDHILEGKFLTFYHQCSYVDS